MEAFMIALLGLCTNANTVADIIIKCKTFLKRFNDKNKWNSLELEIRKEVQSLLPEGRQADALDEMIAGYHDYFGDRPAWSEYRESLCAAILTEVCKSGEIILNDEKEAAAQVIEQYVAQLFLLIDKKLSYGEKLLLKAADRTREQLDKVQAGVNRLEETSRTAGGNGSDVCNYTLAATSEVTAYIGTDYRRSASDNVRQNYHKRLLNFSIDSLHLNLCDESGCRIPEFIIEERLAEPGCTAIVGRAGSGKSTYAKRFFLKCLDEYDEGKKIPVLYELKHYMGETAGEIILESLKQGGKIVHPELIEGMLLNGSFCLILDGYDELAKEWEPVLRKKCLENQNYRKISFLLTARENSSIGCPFFRVEPLGEEDIRHFIEQELSSKAGEIRTLMIENGKFLEMLRNPFTLTVFALLAQKMEEPVCHIASKMMGNQYRFLDMVVQAQLDWNREVMEAFGADRYFIESLVRRISFEMGKELKTVSGQKDLFRLFNVEKQLWGYDTMPNPILTELLLKSGLMIKTAGLYSFPHKNYLLYWQAGYIVGQEAESYEKRAEMIEDPAFYDAAVVYLCDNLEEYTEYFYRLPSYVREKVFAAVEKIPEFVYRFIEEGLEPADIKFKLVLSICLKRLDDETIVDLLLHFFDRVSDYHGGGGTLAHVFSVVDMTVHNLIVENSANMKISTSLFRAVHHSDYCIGLVSDLLRFWIPEEEKEALQYSRFLIDCLDSKNPALTGKIVGNLDYYFMRNPAGYEQVYRRLCEIETENGRAGVNLFLSGEITRVRDSVEPAAFKCSEDIDTYAERMMHARDNQDYQIGTLAASMEFEDLNCINRIPGKIREIIGEKAYLDALLFAGEQPDIEEWDLQSLIWELSSFPKNDLIIAELVKACFFERDHYFINGEWGGIRSIALDGLIRDCNDKALLSLMEEYDKTDDMSYKAFFFMHLNEVMDPKWQEWAAKWGSVRTPSDAVYDKFRFIKKDFCQKTIKQVVDAFLILMAGSLGDGGAGNYRYPGIYGHVLSLSDRNTVENELISRLKAGESEKRESLMRLMEPYATTAFLKRVRESGTVFTEGEQLRIKHMIDRTGE